MANTFESGKGNIDEYEIIPDIFGFKSAGKKYINQNYKRIGRILGIEGEWLGNIKRQANSANRLPDIQGELSLEQINFYRGHYDFPPLTQDEYDSIKSQNTSSGAEIDEQSVEQVKDIKNLEGEIPPNAEVTTTTEPEVAVPENNGGTQSSPESILDTVAGGVVEDVAPPTDESTPEIAGEGRELETAPETTGLEEELSRLVTEAANKLNIEQEQENNQEYISRLDIEKIERFTENARQAIQSYQEFANEHSSPIDNSNAQVQERYRQLEQIAWDALYKLAHALDGEIATLPTDRDIRLSHPGETDIRTYLEARGYEFNEDGDITHITDKDVKIELNRTMQTESLIKSKRPSHIVYDKSISLDNDINYQGYLIRGLNQQTPDFIIGVLDKNNLENVIVDETQQPQTEVSNTNEFNPLQQAQIDRGKEAGFTDEEISRYAKPEYDEVQMRDIFNQILEEKNVNTSVIGFDIPREIPGNSEANNIDTLSDLRLAYARAEEAWNRDRKNIDLENEFDKARDAYNYELERVLKLQVAQGQEANIHELFKNEVISLREERITQSQELQSTWEKRLNPLKEKFVNFVIKHKKLMGKVNLGLGIVGGIAALTGVGIPLAGGFAVTRRAISGILLGVSSGEGVRSLGEDADINLAWGKIKFQAVIPKLVKESLASNEDEFKKVNDDVLKDRLGTLEAYYRLNGGKFTNNDQQKAYEKILTELGHRVRVNTLENYQNTQESSASAAQTQDSNENQDDLQESVDTSSQDNNSNEVVNSNTETFHFDKSRYTLELLNTISDKRVQELDEFRRKRKIATGTGILVGLVAGGVVHALDEMNNPDSLGVPESGGVRPNLPDAGEGNIPNPSSSPEINPGTTSPSPELPPTGAGEALSQSAEATRAAAEQLAQDVSNLSPGETIWSEVAKQLGENATDNQIQQAVENLLQSEVGQNSIYELAQGTEGGRDLLAQWGIDNATEMAELSKEQLYEVSKYLAPGKLQGITELNLDNLTPFEVVEPPQADVSEAMDAADTSVVEAPTPSVEPTTSVTTDTSPIAPEVSPIAGTEFTRDLSEALGTTNLTEAQVGNVLEAYIANEQGRENFYNLIIGNESNNSALSDLLTQYGIIDINDFDTLTPAQILEISQTVGIENLDQLPGFELNDIILSQFEDAPDSLELLKGSSALTSVNQYIANELGNLPYDSNLGKQAIDAYLETPEGKEWFFKAITENPDGNAVKGDVRFMNARLFFNRNGITQGSDIDWNKLDQFRNGYVKHKVFWQDFPFRVDDRTVNISLSKLLQPGEMPGFKTVLQKLLTKQ